MTKQQYKPPPLRVYNPRRSLLRAALVLIAVTLVLLTIVPVRIAVQLSCEPGLFENT